MSPLRTILSLLLAGGLLCAGGCSMSMQPAPSIANGATTQASGMQQALDDVAALSLPAGVDRQLFAALQTALREQLLRSNGVKTASAAPHSLRSRVTNLQATADSATVRFQWHYRNEGDFNQDSIVTAPDLVPLAMYFGHNYKSPDWPLAQVADGNGDGQVSLADIVSIAANYTNRVSHYALEFTTDYDPEGTWTTSATVAFTQSFIEPGHLRQFDFAFDSPPAGYYRVTPYDGTLSGIPGNVVQWPSPIAGPWPMFGQNPQCTRRSPVAASQTGTLQWSFRTGGAGFQFTDALTGPGGEIYVGAGPMLLALNPDGTERWRSIDYYPQGRPARAPDGTLYTASLYHSISAISSVGTLLWATNITTATKVSAPALGPDGTIYASADDGQLHALDLNGQQVWQFPLALYTAYTPPACASDGTIYVGDELGTLYAINPDGSLKWTYAAGQPVYSAPVIGADGTVYLCGYNFLLALNSEGLLQWQFVMGGIGRYGAVQGADGTLYFVDDGGGLTAVSSSGESLWHTGFSATAIASPGIAADGMVCVSARDYPTGTGVLYAFSPAGELQWTLNTEHGLSSAPALGPDGTVYFGTGWENLEPCSLYAASPQGAVQWIYNAGSSIRKASPALSAAGTIYIGDTDGMLYAVNPDGTQQWAYDTGGLIESSPAVSADGTVYVCSGSGNTSEQCMLYAIDASGNVKWSAPDGGWGKSSPVIGVDGVIYTTNQFYPRAYYPDGSLKWNSSLPMSPSLALSSDNSLYFGTQNDQVYSLNLEGVAHSALLQLDVAALAGPAIGADGAVYIGSYNGCALTVLSKEGGLLWTYETLNKISSSPAVAANGTVFACSEDGRLYAFNPDGSLKWSYATWTLINSSPAVGADGVVYFGNLSGQLYAINPDGSFKWSALTGGALSSSPAIGADGTVYVGCENGRLYAYGD